MKKALKAIGIILLALIVVVVGYAAYVLIDYHRLPDTDEMIDDGGAPARAGETYTVVSWNLGFGAYSADFGFFMDGGTESRARSAQAVQDNLGHALDLMEDLDPDLMLLQEIDIGSTRSWHIDEAALVTARLSAWRSRFAQNYDSPYLFYPFLKPHGASKSGILTLTKCAMTRFSRRGLPVETGLTKLLDLDRCYSVTRIPVDNGRELCLYNLHLSAYTSDGSVATEQLRLLCADMLSEYRAGNYVVAGGDFNKDLPGNSGEVFGGSFENLTWAQPIEADIIGEGLALVDSLDPQNPVPSCRNADGPYVPGESLVLTVDGFIVSDNVTVADCHVIDDGFACSDHNPVVMQFELME